nr:hypothetical protein [Tanacetum cinerariifolium]
MRTRKFFQKTSRKITINGSKTAGYDKFKVECFNCLKLGHFARKCRQPRNQDSRNKNQDRSRRTIDVEETSSKGMVAIDGEGFDWSYMEDDEVPTNMALMAFLDSEEFEQPEFEGYGPKTNKSVIEDISNKVKESYDTPLVKKLVSDVPEKDYILLPLWTQDLLFLSSSKDSPSDGFKPSGEEEKKDAKDLRNEDNEVLSTEEPIVNQEKDANVNSTNNINTVSLTSNAASIKDNAVDEDIVYGCADDPNMPNLKGIVYSDEDEDVGTEVDMTNLDTNIPVSLILTTRIHKNHPVEQIIGDIHSTTQTRRMTKNVTNYGIFSTVQQRINHKDF